MSLTPPSQLAQQANAGYEIPARLRTLHNLVIHSMPHKLKTWRKRLVTIIPTLLYHAQQLSFSLSVNKQNFKENVE